MKYALCVAITSAAASAQTGYSGPQILSRGQGAGTRAGNHAGFSVFGGILGSYDTGLVPASVNSSGQILELGGSPAVEANIGAYGKKGWRRTTVGLDYIGNYRHYAKIPSLDGSDHMLMLDLSNQLTKRVQFFTQTGAGTVSRYYATGVSSADLFAVPTYGIFDNRAYYLQNSTGVQYAPTIRLAITASGTGFAVRRQSKALVGLNGYGGEGQVRYRLNRTRSLEASAAYNHFDYPRGFGESDVYTYMLGVSQQFGRRWELGLAGGVSQVNTIGLEQVAADPITAILFGNTTTVQAFDRHVNLGAARASLTGRFRASNLVLAYTQLPNPGNGIYLTSRQSNASASYSHTVIRKVSLSAMVNRMSAGSIGQSQLGTFNYVSAGGAVSYKLLSAMEATARYETRSLDIDRTSGFSRLSYRFSFGLNWHPGDIPISFW